MAKKGIKWNRHGFQQLRKEPGLQDLLNDLAHDVAAEAAAIGGERLAVFEEGSAQDNNSGYQVTPLVLEDPRNATSVMAVGEGHHHNRKYSALLRGLSKTARKNK